MNYISVIWDLDDDPDGNVQHIAEHGLTKEEVEEVLQDPLEVRTSRSSGRPIAFGETNSGRYIAVVYTEIDPDTIRPVTAYEVEEE
jgi:uncharacterized DUF497 family protein